MRRSLTALAIVTALAAAPPSPRLGASSPTPGLPATEQIRVLNAPFNRFSQLTIDPRNPAVMYWVLDSVGVLKSIDGGATWQPKNYGLPNVAARYLTIQPDDPNHLLLGFLGHFTAQGDRPYRSLDGGERWEPTVVCEREDGLVNLRQQCDTTKLLFDPLETNRLYYLVLSQFEPCGAFYRSCDMGFSYDRNPHCIPQAEPRPICAAQDPEPVNNFESNDASILEVDPVTGALYGTTSVHPEESALMTSRDKGGRWTWEDVVDTTGTFVAVADQGRTSLFLGAFALAPSDPSVRYGVLAGPRCTNGKAYPVSFECPAGFSSVEQPALVMRWFGDLSGAGDCQGSNDCDGDGAPDRVWRPIFDPWSRPSRLKITALLAHPWNPDRLFAAGDGATGEPNELLMLTPANPGDPRSAPWQATLLDSGFQGIAGLVQDPTDPDRIYLVDRASIRRIASTDGWATWTVTVVSSLQDLFHVYDLVETRAATGHQIAAATSTALWVTDELGAGWSTGDPFAMHAASRLAVAPADPNVAYAKRTWALTAGASGFASMLDVDDVESRQHVMCTNVFHQVVVDPADASVVYAATGAGIWKHPQARAATSPSDANALSLAWTPVARRANGLDDEYIWSMAFDPADPSGDHLLAGSRSGAIFESADRGLSWGAAAMTLPPGTASTLKDVRDIRFAGGRAYAATGAGVLVRAGTGQSFTPSLSGDRVARLAPGATGTRRVYAAGEAGLHRSRDGGASWETLPLVPRAPYSAVLETTSRDGRHHLWVPDGGAGLYEIATTMTARAGTGAQQIALDWNEDPAQVPLAGYELHYGSDPDLLGGIGAAEGNSPILLGPVATATITGIDLQSGPLYVALRAIGADGQRGPTGLPLEIDAGYASSPRATITDAATCPTALRLGWSPIGGAVGYRVYRGTAGPAGAFTPLATIGPQATAFDDATVQNGASYWYYVTTLQPGGETSGGNIVTDTAVSDSDGDGVANCADDCPADPDPGQIDTDADGAGDACDADDDNDGVDDGADCAPLDPSAFAAPPEIAGLTLDLEGTVVSWNSGEPAAGPGIQYDVLRGNVAQLPPGNGTLESCLASGTASLQVSDSARPLLGKCRYYLVRSRNACGSGSYGAASSGAERTTAICP
ncbi:MAG: hypothetical protein HY049_00360 [Acidobacteria bacterium]|nr:hypothetical protein [Acidobacteriota bacterium]